MFSGLILASKDDNVSENVLSPMIPLLCINFNRATKGAKHLWFPTSSSSSISTTLNLSRPSFLPSSPSSGIVCVAVTRLSLKSKEVSTSRLKLESARKCNVFFFLPISSSLPSRMFLIGTTISFVLGNSLANIENLCGLSQSMIWLQRGTVWDSENRKAL